MGDEAEGVYEKVTPLGSTVRHGWNRNALHKYMTNALSHEPDYYANQGYLVEVMGCAGEIVRAFKVDKWEAMKTWNGIQPMAYFFWNRGTRTWLVLFHRSMVQVIARSRREDRIKAFENDGNRYYEIEWAWLEAVASDKGTFNG